MLKDLVSSLAADATYLTKNAIVTAFFAGATAVTNPQLTAASFPYNPASSFPYIPGSAGPSVSSPVLCLRPPDPLLWQGRYQSNNCSQPRRFRLTSHLPLLSFFFCGHVVDGLPGPNGSAIGS